MDNSISDNAARYRPKMASTPLDVIKAESYSTAHVLRCVAALFGSEAADDVVKAVISDSQLPNIVWPRLN